MKPGLDRRRFLKATAVTAASLGPLRAAGGPASDRIRMALVGCGGRGRRLLRIFMRFAGTAARLLDPPRRKGYELPEI